MHSHTSASRQKGQGADVSECHFSASDFVQEGDPWKRILVPEQRYETTSFRSRRAVRPDGPGRDRHEGMGKVMAAIKERDAGKLDVSKASALVKKILTGGG